MIGTIEGRGERGMQEPELDSVKPVYVDEAAKLAAEIDRFSSDFDSYEYKDTVDNWEAQAEGQTVPPGKTGREKGYCSGK